MLNSLLQQAQQLQVTQNQLAAAGTMELEAQPVFNTVSHYTMLNYQKQTAYPPAYIFAPADV